MRKTLASTLMAMTLSSAAHSQTLDSKCGSPVPDDKVEEIVQSYMNLVGNKEPTHKTVVRKIEQGNHIISIIKADWQVPFGCYRDITLFIVNTYLVIERTERNDEIPAGIVLMRDITKPFDNSKGDLQLMYSPKGYYRIVNP